MRNTPLTNLAITSALWLALLPSISYAQEGFSNKSAQNPSYQAKLFLNAGNLTTIEPLFINFHPQQITLEEENLKVLSKWLEEVKKSDALIHVYSYATPPEGIRDQSEKSANNKAMRKAFNRALDAKLALENQGIPDKQIALHAIGPLGKNPEDQLRITIRND
ncbi:MAG: hypothetical protein HOH19_07790 [Kordiimonadaceae bacterium]|jgi:hypothetical protein|nr:hypothetical protein [Kordiimonadaceae bacterium]MBT6032461.1 hypothetical protein [Kordiimonadaceae bacterium]